MTTDVTSLEIRVLSDKVDQATKRLNAFTKSGAASQKATSGLTSTFSKMLGPLTALVTVTGAFTKLITVAREFDKLNAGLVTATGSAENAKIAFEALQDFATKTPYDLAQVTSSFTKLVNYGLTPSERALYSYGNTASAMGKGMNQMIEAVADATTGEFERLKEFGIRASKQGDKIKFTFRGVSETVGYTTKEVENYLIKLGETNFGDAMENRMKTLDGAMSNFGDEWTSVFRNVSQQGTGSVIEETVRQATNALGELNNMLASGQLSTTLSAYFGRYSGWASDVAALFPTISQAYDDMLNSMDDKTIMTIKNITDSFLHMPENVRMVVQMITVEVASWLDRMEARALAFKDIMKGMVTGDVVGVVEKLNTRLDASYAARKSSLDDIQKERNAAVASYEEQIKKARELREQYDKDKAARGAQGDRLGRFGVGGKQEKPVDKAAQKKAAADFQRLKESLMTEEEAIADSYRKRQRIIATMTKEGSPERSDLTSRLNKDHDAQLEALRVAKGKELEEVRKNLLTEEESIQESYAKRLKIIQDNTAAGSALQKDLMERLQTDREIDLGAIEEANDREKEALYNGLLREEEVIQQSYERRKQAILDSTLITETERTDLMKRLERQRTNELAAAEQKRLDGILTSSATLFSGLAGLAKSYGGEQSKAYKVMFAVSKAFSVAQSIMSITTGLAKAQELGYPMNLVEYARVAATGAGIMSSLNSAKFSGAYDTGGVIGAGRYGIVGENDAELVSGPAIVTGRRQTANKLAANDSSGGSNVQVNVINNSKAQATASETTDSRGNRRVDVTISESVAGEMGRPGSKVNNAMRATFGTAPVLARR